MYREVNLLKTEEKKNNKTKKTPYFLMSSHIYQVDIYTDCNGQMNNAITDV